MADIDQIRSNYGELYEQKTQEREKYLEQMEVQRQLLDFTMEDIASKYNEYLNEQVTYIKQECERKMSSLSSKLDCQMTRLQNDLETKRLELENAELARTTMEKTYNAAVAEDLLAREE